MEKLFNILVIGDVVGRAGRSIVGTRLRGLIDQYRAEMVILNGENSAGGRSITPEIYRNFWTLMWMWSPPATMSGTTMMF